MSPIGQCHSGQSVEGDQWQSATPIFVAGDIAIGGATLRRRAQWICERVLLLSLPPIGAATRNTRPIPANRMEATTGIEPVYTVLQSAPERAPPSANVRHSYSVRV